MINIVGLNILYVHIVKTMSGNIQQYSFGGSIPVYMHQSSNGTLVQIVIGSDITSQWKVEMDTTSQKLKFSFSSNGGGDFTEILVLNPE